MQKLNCLLIIVSLSFFYSCGQTASTETKDESFYLEFEEYQLDNGLKVILHQDKSDPIVAVNMVFNVGSNREEKDKTGFAHLFEHLLFKGSENVPKGEFNNIISEVGGRSNGGTGRDHTMYYEVIPKNALEKILWVESDRLGYFINTITEEDLEIEKQIVFNEFNQTVANRPYGQVWEALFKNIYPEGHPYHSTTIGKMEDLNNATLNDVKEFYQKYYGPNNATLVLVGDFEIEITKKLIEKYFGEIAKKDSVEPITKDYGNLEGIKRVFHEDKLASSPYLGMAFPVVERFHKDYYALAILVNILNDREKGVLHKSLEVETNLSSNYFISYYDRLVSGAILIGVRANEKQNLEPIENTLKKAFTQFEKEMISDEDLEQIKTAIEVDFYGNFDSAFNKSYQLAEFSLYADDLNSINSYLEKFNEVTKADVMRVFKKYIKDEPYVLASFVPKGQMDLVVPNSTKANISEEMSIQPNTKQETNSTTAYKKTPTKIDRSIPPSLGELAPFEVPQNYTVTLDNGLVVYGSELNEIPFVRFGLSLDGGHLFDAKEKNGVANLLAQQFMAGTKTLTSEELLSELRKLGAQINVNTTHTAITFTGSTLSRNFKKTISVLENIIVNPRWDETTFKQNKTAVLNQISNASSNTNALAQQHFDKALYGSQSILSLPILGTETTVNNITLQDLKEFYDNSIASSLARFHVVGNVSEETVVEALHSFETNWKTKVLQFPDLSFHERPKTSKLIFVDVPDANQSVLRIGTMAMARSDKDFYSSVLMNQRLGFNSPSYLNTALREENGYAYSIHSSFTGEKIDGPFQIETAVRSDVTSEAIALIKQVVENYRKNISEEDLYNTKNLLNKSRALYNEGHQLLLGRLERYGNIGKTIKEMEKEETITNEFTLNEARALANEYLDTSKMVYVVVGDANTQFEKVKQLGFDEVELIEQ